MTPTPEQQRAEELMAKGPVWLVRELMQAQARERGLREALELIALHEVREIEPTPCDWHCAAAMVAEARKALAAQSEESDA